MSNKEKCEVLVVGGGPVGLTASLLLSRLGISNLVVEKRGAVGTHPRARGITIHTSEYFRQHGLAEPFASIALPRIWQTRFEYCFDLKRPMLAVPTGRWPDPKTGEAAPRNPYSPAPGILSSQEKIDTLLYDVALSEGADVRLRTELTGYRKHADGVTATLRDSANARDYEVEAQWVFACDGWDSFVRGTEGINWINTFTQTQANLNVQVRADIKKFVVPGREASIHVIMSPEGRGVVCTIDGDQRWQIQIGYDPSKRAASEWTHDHVRERIRTMLGLDEDEEFDIEVLSVSPWATTAAYAEEFVRERIFLLGDAGHVVPPVGGFGLNTGLQDVFNLIWKFQGVHEGWASPRIFATYDSERRHAAMQTVDATRANAMNLAMANMTTDLEQRKKIIRDSSVGSQIGLDLGISYPTGAIVLGENERPPEATSFNTYTPSAGPGHRAPHVWLKRSDEDVSTIDLFGHEFVLLAGSNGQAWAAAAAHAAAATKAPIKAYRVAPDGDLSAGEGDFEEIYGIEPGGAVLVRPDGYVAYRAPKAAGDPETLLSEVMGDILGVSVLVA